MKERSPKFPFVSLSDAIEALRQLDAALQAGSPPNRSTLLKALGYSSEHGAAMKTVAALRGYGLISRQPGQPPELTITDLGRALLREDLPETRLTDLRRAALSPPIFRKIWRKARHFTPSELIEFMRLRGFTDDGAKRAGAVYAANDELARLAELQIEPELPEDRRQRQTQRADRQLRRSRERVEAAMIRQNRRAARNAESGSASAAGSRAPQPGNRLTLPLSTGRVVVPARITEEDFQLLMQTLRLWKPRLVGSGTAESREDS